MCGEVYVCMWWVGVWGEVERGVVEKKLHKSLLYTIYQKLGQSLGHLVLYLQDALIACRAYLFICEYMYVFMYCLCSGYKYPSPLSTHFRRCCVMTIAVKKLMGGRARRRMLSRSQSDGSQSDSSDIERKRP